MSGSQRSIALDQSCARAARRRVFLRAAFASLAFAALPRVARAGDDPLPSWSDCAAKRTLVSFTADVTREGGPRFVAPASRIAVFDNDGTLWSEQPLVEAVYMAAKIDELVAKNPELRKKRAYAAWLAARPELGKIEQEELIQLLADTHTGMTEEEFTFDVQRFLAVAKHPTLGVPFQQLTYQPQLELLAFLRSSGFGIWICTGGEVSFARVIAERAYDVPADRVIGTSFRARLEEQGERLALRRTSQVLSLNDKEAKPENIQQRVGKRPLLAVGNVRSGGDIAMLRYAAQNALPSLSLLIEHDDAQREFAYQEKDGASLAAADRYGFTVVSMKNDWRTVFAFQARARVAHEVTSGAGI